ncbi:tRNA (N6-isopentenyl adenosine(37)-C2)-methylthiotransferase MiaB [Bartonella sp. TP]|uniref:tRNA (N6-isopentenyl adenosine(37)-C2)-methylthiotransferase MiaB n=1 Tax=Bartonella sp. TP TaxID=3057550 RepID=UPI0025B070F6|nr:tRNA (N6-isopentenyl adenosine(37)-C2)-methylthiotransferase MiaB [Bartonella sp. TP]WJW80389.1 tRNA (N6-isopentenyl adenosine(37)-C2)-methylthiotransferase MiaB [Bartonella sp. TP]
MDPTEPLLTPKATRKFFIKTYGCQMNVYDSQRICDSLIAEGYTNTDNVDEADLVLVNTCHIREKAAEKLYSDLGRLRVKSERSGNKKLQIAVAGCVAQAEGEEIFKRAKVVDVIIGPQAYHKLPSLLQQAQQGKKIIDTAYSTEDKFNHLPLPKAANIAKRGITAFLTVQEGCDKFCTFCVVPYTRGAQISRPSKQIIEEATKLVQAGVKEITLLGQNVNAWAEESGKQKYNLAHLLFDLAKIHGIERLRYTTSHPLDMNDDLIAAHRDLDILMPYLHLPVQSGSDKILKAMNRRHNASDYIKLIERIRKAKPDIAFSGDFIVGFPGETAEDFAATVDLVKIVEYSAAYSFKYSPRPGTPGANLTNIVEESIKDARLTQLQALLREQQTAFLKSKINQTTSVLVEKTGRHAGQMIGRSPWLLPVAVNCSAPIGRLVEVTITHAEPNSWLGQYVDTTKLAV